MFCVHASRAGVRPWRALSGTCGGAGWGVTDPAVCRNVAELRPESKFPDQFFPGNNEDCLWSHFHRCSGTGRGTHGAQGLPAWGSLWLLPDCLSDTPGASCPRPGRQSSVPGMNLSHEALGPHPPSSWPLCEGRDWEAGVGVSVGTGPEQGTAGTLGVSPSSGPEASACPTQGSSFSLPFTLACSSLAL